MSNKTALEALQLAYIAMQHMGNVLNKMDAVDEEEDAQHDAAFEAVSAAIAALEAMEAGGWLPIASAPKDGTFLVYTPTEREDRRYQVMHRQKSLAVIGGCFAFDCDPPTHWAPLPTPPKD